MKRKLKRRITAYHEAGHAVIARVLTLACGEATIKPDYRERTAGYAATAAPDICINEWERRGKMRRSDDVAFRARIIGYMAGAETEAVLLGNKATGDSDDRKQIALMAECLGCDPDEFWDRIEVRLRTMTRTLIRRHRQRVLLHAG